MIEVERLNGKKYWINPHMIESMEEMPDLTLTMLSGKKIIVKNSSDDILGRIIAYRRKLSFASEEI